MSAVRFTEAELAAAAGRGVRQCVCIGSRPALHGAFLGASQQALEVFAVDEEQSSDLPATFIRTRFASETLALALTRSHFDTQKPSLFVWLGGAGYRTFDAALTSLMFIASLPRGSGLVFDYIVERARIEPLTHTALDGLASCISGAGSTVKHLIEPRAVAALLRGLGFQKIVDLAQDHPFSGGRLVSAVI